MIQRDINRLSVINKTIDAIIITEEAADLLDPSEWQVISKPPAYPCLLNPACWDIVVGTDEQPIFIELNFWGPIWLYQLAWQGAFFGNLTEEVLACVKAQRELATKGGKHK